MSEETTGAFKPDSVSLTTPGRSQALSVTSQDNNLFPFDAFTFDDPNQTTSPVLAMDKNWAFDVGEISTSKITNFKVDVKLAAETDSLQQQITEITVSTGTDFLSYHLDRVSKELQSIDAEHQFSMSQIIVGQGQIDIRVGAVEEDTQNLSEAVITLDAGLLSANINIQTNLDVGNNHSTAFVNLGVDPNGSSISIGADKIVLGGTKDLDEFMTINSTTGRVDIDGDIYAENGFFKGDITGASGTFTGDIITIDSSGNAIKLSDGNIAFWKDYNSSNPIYSGSIYGSIVVGTIFMGADTHVIGDCVADNFSTLGNVVARLALSGKTLNVSETSTFSGLTSLNGGAKFQDYGVLYFGSGNDVEFFCNGGHMFTNLNSGIGNWYIRDGGTTRFTFDDSGSFRASTNLIADQYVWGQNGYLLGSHATGRTHLGGYNTIASICDNDFVRKVRVDAQSINTQFYPGHVQLIDSNEARLYLTGSTVTFFKSSGSAATSWDKLYT